mmetsp:Transcript_58129/g.101773  ORF Transcript_58129/g.101773 Transcript_58129/m.101773 type:complete len:377 (-) Transcript_58129:47-1177(-)
MTFLLQSGHHPAVCHPPVGADSKAISGILARLTVIEQRLAADHQNRQEQQQLKAQSDELNRSVGNHDSDARKESALAEDRAQSSSIWLPIVEREFVRLTARSEETTKKIKAEFIDLAKVTDQVAHATAGMVERMMQDLARMDERVQCLEKAQPPLSAVGLVMDADSFASSSAGDLTPVEEATYSMRSFRAEARDFQSALELAVQNSPILQAARSSDGNLSLAEANLQKREPDVPEQTEITLKGLSLAVDQAVSETMDLIQTSADAEAAEVVGSELLGWSRPGCAAPAAPAAEQMGESAASVEAEGLSGKSAGKGAALALPFSQALSVTPPDTHRLGAWVKDSNPPRAPPPFNVPTPPKSSRDAINLGAHPALRGFK